VDLDLARAPNDEERNEDGRACIYHLWCPPSTNPRAKLLPLEFAQFLGFWSSKPEKLEEEMRGRRRGAATERIHSHKNNGGGQNKNDDLR